MLLGSLDLVHVGRPPTKRSDSEPPMLILLHGIGSDEKDLFALAGSLDPRFHVLGARGPFALAPGRFGWWEAQFSVSGTRIRPNQAEESRQKLIRFIDQAVRHYRTDPRRVFLLGFSQGATLSLAMALTRPDLLCGVAAIAGRLPDELYASTGPLAGKLAAPEALAKLPLFMAHGTEDTVVEIQEGREARDRLMQRKMMPTFREYPMGHSIAPACLADLSTWLTARLDVSH